MSAESNKSPYINQIQHLAPRKFGCNDVLENIILSIYYSYRNSEI